jgi:very-short-patch-repair endonuclease
MKYRICIGCGRKFYPHGKKGVKGSYSKFCSPSCRKKYIYKSYMKNGKYLRYYGKCAYCDKETYTILKTAKHMFCSKKCKGLWQKENLRGKNNPNFGKRHPGLSTGRICSEETKQKIRESTINQLKRDKYSYDTKIEKAVENQLLFNNILYIKQYRYKLGIADFWLPKGNLIVECDGDYWHSRPETMVKDKIKTTWLEDNDYVVLRLTETEIKNDIGGCLERIQLLL